MRYSKQLIIVLFSILLHLSTGMPCEAQLSDCIDATCRVSTSSGSGTGCAFWRSGGYLFVLSNAHVVEGEKTVKCEFWREGRPSSPVDGRVCFVNEEADISVIAIAESALGQFVPKTVPIAEPDYKLRPGDTVASVGCAGGRWPTAWRGHVVEVNGTVVRFVPPPAGGRSGSAIFDSSGTKIVALLRARDDLAGEGIATSLDALHRTLDAATGSGNQRTQCPGGTCSPFGFFFRPEI